MRRLPMRKIAEALRLRATGLSTRKIASSLGVGQSTVSEYLKRAERSGLSWPIPADVTDADLQRRLFEPQGGKTRRGLVQPDWAMVHRELRRRGVTLSLIWEEYRAAHPANGYGYSRFCDLYRRWEGRLSPTMRQHHVAGERVFVDYAGDTLDVVDAQTGEIRAAQVFVGVLGASNYTYAEATWTQTLPDWSGAHVRMLGFFGGVPEQLVSDNLKAGVTKACFHEPRINRTYAEMAAHYDTAVIPARPYKPRDTDEIERPLFRFCAIVEARVTTWQRTGREVQVPSRGLVIVVPRVWRPHPPAGSSFASPPSCGDRRFRTIRRLRGQHVVGREDCMLLRRPSFRVRRAVRQQVPSTGICAP
ncbi:Transposase [Tranquillimonas alkanivorans]|uniref:Transposase n=1 Tax=Tranquillimonas alkanivorans TaxID=441119 RepID=A0A1I5UXS6_9RHOB|nr:Transposase [Tranquillimonas alkanivorans]